VSTIKSVDEKVEVIRESQIRMEVDLKEHMRRTDVLEKLHMDNQVRIEGLEAPKKAREYFVSVVVDISKFTGFVLSVIAVLSYFNVI
jgi:hypothetical protein